jgi:hypothetical protein
MSYVSLPSMLGRILFRDGAVISLVGVPVGAAVTETESERLDEDITDMA